MEYEIDYMDFDLEKMVNESLLINDDISIVKENISIKNGGAQISRKDWVTPFKESYIEKEFYPALKEYLNSEADVWINFSYPKSYNKSHNHSLDFNKNIFSGVYYVKVPEESGDLIFPNSGDRISPKEGMTVLFHSSIWHAVEPNLSNDLRISFAFNYYKK